MTEATLDKLEFELKMSGGHMLEEEVLRLARLGLWVEKHALPTLRVITRAAYVNDYNEHGHHVKTKYPSDLAQEILDLLPKEILK